jgi:hypothetical protein
MAAVAIKEGLNQAVRHPVTHFSVPDDSIEPNPRFMHLIMNEAGTRKVPPAGCRQKGSSPLKANRKTVDER